MCIPVVMCKIAIIAIDLNFVNDFLIVLWLNPITMVN